MSLVWTLIATFLYAEIAVVLLLVLPVASPYRWQRFFKSKFLAMLGRQAHTYFFLILGVLVLFLLEAIREMRKYSSHDQSGDVHLNVEMQHSMRLFRAQRNFYISGFSIFLVLVIRRLVTLISAQATLLAQSEASMKQAQSATAAARTLMAGKPAEKAKEAKEDGGADNTVGEITDLRRRVQELTASLNREQKDKEALKSQAESLNREYDRLTEEYSKLQKKVTVSSGGSSAEKDD